MASQFHHRLVGTIALISIGIIFLPDVLDGEKIHYQETFQAIPLQPVIESDLDTELVLAPLGLDTDEFNDGEKDLIGDLISTLTEKDSIEKALNKEKIKEPDLIEHFSDNSPVTAPIFDETAWVIRLATFKNSEYAKSLVDRLRKKGFTAQMSPRVPKEGQFVRVEVGPELSKQKLADMIKELESITGLKGQLLRFDPLKS